jgi:hypothetical protein
MNQLQFFLPLLFSLTQFIFFLFTFILNQLLTDRCIYVETISFFLFRKLVNVQDHLSLSSWLHVLNLKLYLRNHILYSRILNTLLVLFFRRIFSFNLLGGSIDGKWKRRRTKHRIILKFTSVCSLNSVPKIAELCNFCRGLNSLSNEPFLWKCQRLYQITELCCFLCDTSSKAKEKIIIKIHSQFRYDL